MKRQIRLESILSVFNDLDEEAAAIKVCKEFFQDGMLKSHYHCVVKVINKLQAGRKTLQEHLTIVYYAKDTIRNVPGDETLGLSVVRTNWDQTLTFRRKFTQNSIFLLGF